MENKKTLSVLEKIIKNQKEKYQLLLKKHEKVLKKEMSIIYKIRIDISIEEINFLQEANWEVETKRLNSASKHIKNLVKKGLIYEVIHKNGVDRVYWLTDFGEQMLQCSEFQLNLIRE